MLSICSAEKIYGYTPYAVKGDGSCLFNALSLALFATQTYSYEFRVRLSLYMYDNPDLLTTNTLSKLYGRQLTDDDREILLQSSISRKDFVTDDITTTIKNRARTMLRVKEYGSMVEVIYMASLLNIEINVIYPPELNLFTRKALFSGKIKPTGASRKFITIAWTHTDNTSTQKGNWIPNHFVPCRQSGVVCGMRDNDTGEPKNVKCSPEMKRSRCQQDESKLLAENPQSEWNEKDECDKSANLEVTTDPLNHLTNLNQCSRVLNNRNRR